jgi:hypothetical protein
MARRAVTSHVALIYDYGLAVAPSGPGNHFSNFGGDADALSGRFDV